MPATMRGSLYQPFPMLPGRRAQAWRHQPAFRRPRHFHAEPELNLVLSGSALLGVGEHEVRAVRGDIVVFQPGQDHVLLDASADLDLFVVALRPELAERAGLVRALVSRQRLDEGERSSAEESLRLLAGVSFNEPHERVLTELFQRLAQRAPDAHVVSRRALERLLHEPAASGSVLARTAGTASSGVSRHFREDFGVRMVEYRARLRLMRFVSLVDAGSSLSQSALEADFGSYAQCHRVFQQSVGLAPKAYFAGARRALDALVIAPEHTAKNEMS